MTIRSGDERRRPAGGLAPRILLRLLVTLVIVAIAPNHAQAIRIRLSRQERAIYLGQGAQKAGRIVIATIADTSFFAESTNIFTRYGLKVDTVLKGPAEAGPLSFVERGGAIGERVMFSPDIDRFYIGSRYLLFLARCDDNSVLWRSVSRACIAEIDDSTAVTGNPMVCVSTAALLDSIRSYVRVCSYEHQAGECDVAVLGEVLELDGSPTDYGWDHLPGQGTLRVESFFRRRKGPSLPTGTELSFSVPAQPKSDSPDAQWSTKAPIMPGGTYVLFLAYSDGSWSLLPSIYAAWRKEGDRAVVRAVGFPCGRTPYDVERVPWEEIMGFLRK